MTRPNHGSGLQVYIVMEHEPVYGSEWGRSSSPISVHQDKGDAETFREAKRKERDGKDYWSGGGNHYTIEGPLPVDMAGAP